MFKLIILLFLSLNIPFVFADAEKGLSLMQQADKANSGFNGEHAVMEMILINAHGTKITRKIKSKSIEVQGDGDKSIITFLWPADVKGTKLLTWAHKSKSDDQWLFLPALKRVKRISSRNMTGSFMGSEFSYEDIGSQELEKYTYKFIKEETINGRPTSVIERKSTDKNSGYAKQVLYLDKEYQGTLKIEYFDRKNELLKISSFTDWKKLGNFWRFHNIEVKNVQTRKGSILNWSERKLNQKINEREFTQNKIKN